MSFGKALRNLVEITDTSLKEIAITVGYENSYISKWYNDKNLPAKRNVNEIINELATLFAKNIDDEGINKILAIYPYLVDVVYKVSTKELIDSILNDAYLFSIKEEEINRNRLYKKLEVIPSIQINGNIGDKLATIINSNIDEAYRKNNIYSDFDIFKYLSLNFLQTLKMTYTKSIPFVFTGVFNIDEPIGILEEKILKYFIAAEKMYFMDIELYYPDDDAEISVAMKNNFAGFGAQIDKDTKEIKILFYSPDKNTANSTYNELKEKFARREKLIEIEYNLDKIHAFLEKASSIEESVFLMPFLHPGLAGEEFMDSLIRQHREHELCVKTAGFLTEIFAAAKRKKIIILKSALDELYNNHTIGHYSFSTKLYDDEIDTYIEGFKRNAIKYNAEIHIYDDTKSENIMPKLLIYSTGDNAIYMKAESNIYEGLGIFFNIKEKKISKLIFNLLNNLETKKIL